MKTTKKQSAAFMKHALEILRRFGFQHDASMREYSAETVIGKLHVSIKEDWLSCVFDDVKKAALHMQENHDTRINPHSGKWNWMEPSYLPYFESALGRLIVNPVANPELSAIPKKLND
jgi:hypothetical protein